MGSRDRILDGGITTSKVHVPFCSLFALPFIGKSRFRLSVVVGTLLKRAECTESAKTLLGDQKPAATQRSTIAPSRERQILRVRKRTRCPGFR